MSVTAHSYLAVDDDVTDEALAGLGVNGLGGASNARTTVTLAGTGYVECLDILLGQRTSAAEEHQPLVDRRDLADHPRSALAALLRSDVRVLGRPATDDVVVTLARGIAGLDEIGIELAGHETGQGRAVVRAALATLPAGTPVLAACSPGNARAVRTFLSSGFVPLGEVQLWCPERGGQDASARV